MRLMFDLTQSTTTFPPTTSLTVLCKVYMDIALCVWYQPWWSESWLRDKIRSPLLDKLNVRLMFDLTQSTTTFPSTTSLTVLCKVYIDIALCVWYQPWWSESWLIDKIRSPLLDKLNMRLMFDLTQCTPLLPPTTSLAVLCKVYIDIALCVSHQPWWSESWLVDKN